MLSPNTAPPVVTVARPGAADLAAIQHHDGAFFPFLLESAGTGKPSGHSILFACPGETLECPDPTAAADFLAALAARCPAFRPPPDAPDIPFRGGWFVYLGYELVKGIEPRVAVGEPAYRFPVAFATRCHAAIIVDHALSTTVCIAERGAQAVLPRLRAMLERTTPEPGPITPQSLIEEPPNRYLHAAQKALDYIRSGDVFQVNLSRRWRARLGAKADPHALYRRLRRANPAPFACLVRHPQGAIVSSSPERLVRAAAGTVEARPIAGTRPRAADRRDRQRLRELKTDAKECAEHIMLIDLARNDLGRLCRPGSIVVNEFMTVESYRYVHHIVSNIRGRLAPGVRPVDVIRAVFPGGTITGCPKVRCMQIITELERHARGPYTGSVGYINNDGAMDLNILIRTLFVQGRDIHFNAGAGIVADSEPRRELAETRHKARGLLAALGRH